MGERGWAGWNGVKGEEWDNCNSIINKYIKKKKKKKCGLALAGVAQWIESWPVSQKVTGLVPGQDTGLSCGPSPQLGVCKRQPIVSLTYRYFSLSPSLPRFLKINK